MAGQMRHIKRGDTYDIVGSATVQVSTEPLVDYDEVIVYKSKTNGRLWVRRKSECYDGRFEHVIHNNDHEADGA